MKSFGNSVLSVGLAALTIIAMTAASVAAFCRADAGQSGKQSTPPKKNAPAQKPAAGSTGWWIKFSDTRDMISQDGTPCKVTLVMDLKSPKSPNGYGIYSGKSAVSSVGTKQGFMADLHILTEDAVIEVTFPKIDQPQEGKLDTLSPIAAPGTIACEVYGEMTHYLASLETTVGGTRKPDKTLPFTISYILRTPKPDEKTAGPRAIFFELMMGPGQKVVFEGRYGHGADR